MKRRNFLRTTAAMATVTILPSGLLKAAPNDKPNIAAVGFSVPPPIIMVNGFRNTRLASIAFISVVCRPCVPLAVPARRGRKRLVY